MATKKNEQSTEVTTKSAGALALDTRPDFLKAGGHRGSEDVTARDIILPRLEVIQAISPQLKRNEAAYIEGAEQGRIFNTVSKELYPEEVIFVPVVFQREYIIWKDRKAGGGFKGSFQTEAEANDEMEQLEDGDSCEVVETHVHFILIVHPDGRTEEAVLSMAKSKRKVSRKLNTLVQMVDCDRFGRMYKLTTVEDKSPKGDFWNFSVENVGWTPEPIYLAAQRTYEAVKAGQRGVDRSDDGDSDEPTSGKL